MRCPVVEQYQELKKKKRKKADGENFGSKNTDSELINWNLLMMLMDRNK